MSVWIFCPILFVVEMCAVFVRTVLVYVDKIAAQSLLTASIPAIKFGDNTVFKNWFVGNWFVWNILKVIFYEWLLIYEIH